MLAGNIQILFEFVQEPQVQILDLPCASNLSASSFGVRVESLNVYQKPVVIVTIDLKLSNKLWPANLPCLYSPTQKSRC
jgi:hypothetical protein